MNKPLRSTAALADTKLGGQAKLYTAAKNAYTAGGSPEMMAARLRASLSDPAAWAALIEWATFAYIKFVVVPDVEGCAAAVGQSPPEALTGGAPAAVSHSEAGEGQVDSGTQIFRASPASEPQADGRGQSLRETKTNIASPVRDSPRFTPGRSTRGVTAIASVQPTMKRSLMHRHRTADGKPWAEVGWHEVVAIDRDGRVARWIKDNIAEPAKPTATLAEIMSDEQFSRCLREALGVNDA